MSRNLEQQFNYCIYQCDYRGSSKRTDRKNKVDMKTRLYSNQRIHDLRDTAKSFGIFMKVYYPEIRMVDQVTSDHIQKFIDSKKDSWSKRTEEEQISRLGRLNEITNHVYGRNNHWQMHGAERINHAKIRDIAMSREDYSRINESLQKRHTEAKHVTEITARCGLRIAEVAGLKVSGIRTDTWVIEVREGAKNNNWRDVPIREADRKYFADLKADMTSRGRIYVTNGVKPKSLDRAIRREMKELGLTDKYTKTTSHSIRKMYARERMEEERKVCKTEEEAWVKVQQELGHGNMSRKKLYEAYVGGNLL